MRLNQYLSLAGVASRRKADALIKDGEVTVNGKRAHLGDIVKPEKDIIKLDGKVLKVQQFVYYKYYKPVGVLSSLSDPHHQKTLAALPIKDKFFPVGRLDLNSEGLMLLTNDGKLAQRLTHPSHHETKEYLVKVDTTHAYPDWLYRLKQGAKFEERVVKPVKVGVLSKDNKTAELDIVLAEGIKREIRRLAEGARLQVIRLKRIRIGSLTLGTLKSGELKILSAAEIDALTQIHP
jgi:23S rRNA pseudouridine2605 synthase